MRAYLHSQIDNFANTPGGPFDANGKLPSWAQPIFSGEKAVVSALPGPASDALVSGIDTFTSKQASVGALHAAVDTAFDPATRVRVMHGVGRGVQQGLSGFNEGVGNVVFTPSDALATASDYIAGKITNATGGTPAPTLPSTHDYYNQAFVAPAGAPDTPLEKRIRGTAQSFGTDLPSLLLGAGVGAAGVRSGVTMAEQAAPGLLEKISAPAGTIVGKLRDMIPSFINGLRPTNIANAVRASNMQGAADTALQRVAAHPNVAAYGDLSRDWRNTKRLQTQQDVE